MFVMRGLSPNRFVKAISAIARSLALVVLALTCTLSRSETVDVSQLSRDSLGALGLYADVFSEDQAPLTLDAARALFREGQFKAGTQAALSFGIGARPVWVRLALFNPDDRPKTFSLNLGMTWIDHLDAYLISAEGVVDQLQVGDSLPGALGVVPGIGTAWLVSLPAGHSELYLRAQTPDPLLLPISLSTERDWIAGEHQVHYVYGALYGFLLALIIYNCVLYFGLYRRSYLYYALYVLCFIVMNYCYTGHGFAYLWPTRPDIQRFVIVAFILIYAVSGLLFASAFLELDKYAPRLNLWVGGFGISGLLAMVVCIVLDSQLAAVLLAFSFLSSVTGIMVGLGVYAVVTRRDAGAYFLAATLCGMVGAATTTISVWGAIPYNVFTYHGIEAGIVMEATLLALALARQVRYKHIALSQAEFLAQHDPLTGLHNRRAFLDLSKPAWAQAQRNARPFCVLMLDIDHFKQINDQFGHVGGDQLLISMSQLLLKTRRVGDLLARWGGEEFVLLLPETDLGQARVFAERIRQIIQEYGDSDAQGSVRCTASIGVAEYAGDPNMDALIARADARLYEAKAGGRNKVCW